MVELEKRISGDWIELKEKSNDFHSLLDHLGVTPPVLVEAAGKLRRSVEQGIIEWKRANLSPVLVALEAARYKSLAGVEMTEQENALTVILLLVSTQRLLATESLPLSRPQEEKRSFGVEQMQVNVILSDVNSRIKANPDLRSHPSIKNILAQVALYNKENQKMKELLPGIKQEMRTSFLANFTKTFDEIIGSIRRNYMVVLQERAAAEKAGQEAFTFALLPLKEIAPLLVNQAKEVSRMRSTLAHAQEEKYKTREVLVRLYESRHDLLGLIEEEVKVYRGICKRAYQYDLDACALEIANGYRDEIAAILEKQGRREDQESGGA